MKVKVNGEYLDGVTSVTRVATQYPDELPVWAVEVKAGDEHGNTIGANGAVMMNLIHSTDVELG